MDAPHDYVRAICACPMINGSVCPWLPEWESPDSVDRTCRMKTARRSCAETRAREKVALQAPPGAVSALKPN